MKKSATILASGFLLLAVAISAWTLSLGRPDPSANTVELITPVYDVDQLFLSMRGPEYTNKNLSLLPNEAPELLWVTGYEAIMVAPDGETQKSQQFMCHNTLTIHRGLDEHRKLFGARPYGTRRLFTLSQGQYEVEMPKGFGIPLVSTERLMLQSQVLNLNEDHIGQKVRHKVKAHFLRDTEAKQEMTPLCMFPSGIAVRIGDPDAAEMPNDPELGCAVPADDGSSGKLLSGHDGTGHWILREGRDERLTNLGKHFPFDTKIHYIAVHLHPYAESFEVRDRTTGESLWTAKASQTPGSIGLDSLTHYSSEEGIPVFKDHEYELVSVYNNTSGKEQTAMAFMFFYVEDKGFHRPTEETLARSDESFCNPDRPASMLR